MTQTEMTIRAYNYCTKKRYQRK